MNALPKRWFLPFLFLLVTSVYWASIAGITSSNDGSHFALLRAMTDQQQFEISDYLSFTENQDYALNGDLYFSDRPPGTAWLTLPTYLIGQWLPALPLPTSKHDANNPHLLYALIPTVTAAGVAVLLLYSLLTRSLQISPAIATFTVLSFALGSIHWKYATLLYSHAMSSGLLWVVLGLSLHWREHSPRPWQNLLLGFLLGALVWVEYTNMVAVAWIGSFYCLWQWKNRTGLFWFVLGGVLAGLVLMSYNLLNFGSPFELSTFNVDTTRWPQNKSFANDFATPIWQGLPALLVWGNDNQGLFLLSPVAIVGLWGIRPLWCYSRILCVFLLGLFGCMLALFSMSTTFNPATNDGRYLTPFLGLWFVAVAFGIQALPKGVFTNGVLAVLGWLSLQNQIWHIAYSWGHSIDLSQWRSWSIAPDNLARLSHAVFHNWQNLPAWWLLLAGVAGLAGLARTLWFARSPKDTA
ncbi:MAG TPA: hypothetical protein PK299_01415 [Anaerolineales bacterium]|nr:hypothetical protein [Anaerolineales bacterium]